MLFGQEVTTGEKINKFLLSSEIKGKPVWLVAAQNIYLESPQKFGTGIKETKKRKT